MITEVEGSIFEDIKPYTVIVHQCNAKGWMQESQKKLDADGQKCLMSTTSTALGLEMVMKKR